MYKLLTLYVSPCISPPALLRAFACDKPIRVYLRSSAVICLNHGLHGWGG